MHVGPLSITRDRTILDALRTLERTRHGLLLLVDASGVFERTITDGDLRRLILEGATNDSSLAPLPRQTSHVIAPGFTGRAALELMQRTGVNHLPVVGSDGRAVDLVVRADIDQQILLSTPHMGDDERAFVEQAFETNWIAPLGPNVDAFEREMAEMIGASYTVALSSGTAAIHLALVLLDVVPGDLIFCSSLTFIGSVNPILYQRAEPVFIDSEPDSWNMSPAALEKAFQWAAAQRRKPKAVIVVDLYGQSADMDPITEICARYGVPIIEDAAEAVGAKYKGRPNGTMGEIGIFSFNGNKIITTSGGGMLITEKKELADRARYLAAQARQPAAHYEHTEVGYNYRLSNILASVGRGQLRVLDKRVAARRAVFERYSTQLGHLPWIKWMGEPEWSFSTRWLSTGTIEPNGRNLRAPDVIHALADELIEGRPVWKPMQLQPIFRDAHYVPHDADDSVSQRLFENGICLPSGSNMTEQQVDKVVAVLRKLDV